MSCASVVVLFFLEQNSNVWRETLRNYASLKHEDLGGNMGEKNLSSFSLTSYRPTLKRSMLTADWSVKRSENFQLLEAKRSQNILFLVFFFNTV